MISIVVPVYNAAAHLPRCIDSILEQSYTDFELILVDDGSIDLSGAICDKYAETDSRIRVFHQKNQGVSAARNYGLEHMSGKYLCFVDADDYVGRDYLRILHEMIVEHDADITLVSAIEVSTPETQFSPSDDIRRRFDGKEAFREIVTGGLFGWASWGKLYRKELFENRRFPQGIIYDDFYTIPYLLEDCGTCVGSTSKQYYYYQCEDSLTHSISDESISMWLKGMDMLFQYTQEKYPDFSNLIERIFILNIFRIIIDRLLYDSDYKKKAVHIKNRYHTHFRNGLKVPGITAKGRIGTFLFLIHPDVYRFVRLRWIRLHRDTQKHLLLK